MAQITNNVNIKKKRMKYRQCRHLLTILRPLRERYPAATKTCPISRIPTTKPPVLLAAVTVTAAAVGAANVAVKTYHVIVVVSIQRELECLLFSVFYLLRYYLPSFLFLRVIHIFFY